MKRNKIISGAPGYNKPNAATIPAQMLIHRKVVLQNKMIGCTLYSILDLLDRSSNELLLITHENGQESAHSD